MNRAIVISLICMAGLAGSFNELPALAAATKETTAPKKELRKVVFNVGLHCQNCVKKVKENISFEKGVKELEISLEKKTVTISYDPSRTDVATLKKAIEKLGYKTEVVSAD